MQQLTRQGYFPNASFTAAHIRSHCVASSWRPARIVLFHAMRQPKDMAGLCKAIQRLLASCCSSRSTVCSIPQHDTIPTCDTVGEFKFHARIDVNNRLKLSIRNEFANGIDL
jgi:hypothetical protein